MERYTIWEECSGGTKVEGSNREARSLDEAKAEAVFELEGAVVWEVLALVPTGTGGGVDKPGVSESSR